MIRRFAVALVAAMISCAPVSAAPDAGCFPTEAISTAIANGLIRLPPQPTARFLDWFNAIPPQSNISGVPVFARDFPDRRVLFLVVVEGPQSCVLRFADDDRMVMLAILSGRK